MYTSLKSILQVFEVVNKFKPDLILLEWPGFLSAVSLIIKRILKVPLIVRVKGDLWQTYAEIDHNLPLYEKLAKYLNYKAGNMILEHADAILPISDHIGDITRGKLRTSKPMFTVYIPFIEAPYKDLNDSVNPENIFLHTHEEFVLTVTNFNFWAKVEPLLHAIKKITPVIKELGVEWIILGDGFFFEKFKQSVRESIDSESIRFMGRQNPNWFYSKARALVYISGMDGLPNVLLEASYFKLPTVINKECDSVEFIVNGYNGIIADFDDRSQVRDILHKIVNDNEYRNAMSDNSYSYLQEHFSVRQVSSQLEKAINYSLADSGD